MKKHFTTASPFLMLLIPVFLCIALLLINSGAEIPADNATASTFKLPALQNIVRAVF